jgi:molybdopterin synthase catalytic subunit
MLIEITDHIDIARAQEYLQSDDAGGVNLFIGTVRNHAKGKEVVKLVFEAYEPMAMAEMKRIAKQAQDQWQLSGLVMLHVVGERQIGEAVVLVGASAPHRQESFEACRFLIDELKARVPIWKKEYYKDSSIWVNAHP